MSRNLDQKDLYEAVKTVVEKEDNHLHFGQHKLFTLFSIAFNYFMFKSTKKPGAYLIRVEDRHLADKLARKAKDQTTRRFFEKIILPRRFKYGKSTFYLDYFQMSSWAQTAEIQADKWQGAIIVKNTTSRPMEESELADGAEAEMIESGSKYYFSTLRETMPETITIAYECDFEGTSKLEFPFIKKDIDRGLSGVKLASDLSLEEDL